jgi:hypothetical protein
MEINVDMIILTILEENSTVTEPEMNQSIGIMFALTTSLICNIENFWKEDSEMTHNFESKLNMGKTRFKFISKHSKTAAAQQGPTHLMVFYLSRAF